MEHEQDQQSVQKIWDLFCFEMIFLIIVDTLGDSWLLRKIILSVRKGRDCFLPWCVPDLIIC